MKLRKQIVALLFLALTSFLYSESLLAQKIQQEAEGCSGKARFLARHSVITGGYVDPQIDVHYYKLALDISVSSPYLRGTVTVKAQSLSDSLTRIILNLADPMMVDSIFISGVRTTFNRSAGNLLISTNRTYRIGNEVEMEIHYRGFPSATGFGSFAFSNHTGTPWIWSLSEPYGASDWWPCKDHPSDKADSVDVWVTCNQSFKVGSNGKLIAVLENGNGTHTYKWAERYPIATYLVSVAITNFAEFSNWFRYSPTDSMEVLNYVLPEHLDEARQALPVAVDALRIFSERYGMYPFIHEKYGHSEFGHLAMEHQTMTSTSTFNELTIVHELAHQWFGDLISPASWAHLWLSEGFATYSEAIWSEARYGQAGYRNVMNLRMDAALKAVGSLVVQDTSTVASLFQTDRVYSKGATVLHMLRHILGDSVFFGAMRSYVADPTLRYNIATTVDFQRACETYSGKQLDYFFNEWLYGEKFPIYDLEWHADSAAHRVVVQINQETHTANPSFFTMPVDVRLSASNWDTTVVLFHSYSGQEFTIETSHVPFSVVLDPDRWILQLRQNANTLLTDFALDQNYPNPFNPKTTIRFHLPHRTAITLKIINLLGEEIATLAEGKTEAGSYVVDWDGAGKDGLREPSGVYFYRLAGESFAVTKKLMLLK